MTKENFNRIMAGLEEVQRHAAGEDVPGMVIHRPRDECPKCKADLDGGSIWDHFMTRHDDEAKADRIAAMYGATRTTGRFSRKIAIYDQDRDRTVGLACPDCGHQWERT